MQTGKFHTHIDNLPLSFSLILLNRSTQRLSSSFGFFSRTALCESFNASSTKTVCTMDWNCPSVYMFHSSFAACSLDRRKVKIMEPLEVFTNTAPLGRCYKRMPCMLLSSSSSSSSQERIKLRELNAIYPHIGPISWSRFFAQNSSNFSKSSSKRGQKLFFGNESYWNKETIFLLLSSFIRPVAKTCKLNNKSKLSKHLEHFYGVTGVAK